jgi:hypothetical protein
LNCDLLEIFLGDVRALAKLAEVADPDVPLEAHDDRRIDGGHQCNLCSIPVTFVTVQLARTASSSN